MCSEKMVNNRKVTKGICIPNKGRVARWWIIEKEFRQSIAVFFFHSFHITKQIREQRMSSMKKTNQTEKKNEKTTKKKKYLIIFRWYIAKLIKYKGKELFPLCHKFAKIWQGSERKCDWYTVFPSYLFFIRCGYHIAKLMKVKWKSLLRITKCETLYWRF